MKTKQTILIALKQTLLSQYDEQLAEMPLKPATREILHDGFRDGLNAGVHHTIEMLGVEVEA